MPFSTNRRRASSEIRLRVLLPSRMGSPWVVGRAGSYVNDRSQKMKGEAPVVKGGSGDRIRANAPHVQRETAGSGGKRKEGSPQRTRRRGDRASPRSSAHPRSNP